MTNYVKIKEVAAFEGGYHRKGVIELAICNCAICGEHKRCLYIDGSEGEYGGAAVCGTCATRECEASETTECQ